MTKATIDIKSVSEKVQQVISTIDLLQKQIKALKLDNLQSLSLDGQQKRRREQSARSHFHKACSQKLDNLQSKINFIIKLVSDYEGRQLRLSALYKKLQREQRI